MGTGERSYLALNYDKMERDFGGFPMSISQQEFDSFADFGRSRIVGSQGSGLTLDDLVVEWESQQHRAEINAAIREGLADADAGRYRPAREVVTELRAKHGLTEE
jgi:hypothetical protein